MVGSANGEKRITLAHTERRGLVEEALCRARPDGPCCQIRLALRDRPRAQHAHQRTEEVAGIRVIQAVRNVQSLYHKSYVSQRLLDLVSWKHTSRSSLSISPDAHPKKQTVVDEATPFFTTQHVVDDECRRAERDESRALRRYRLMIVEIEMADP